MSQKIPKIIVDKIMIRNKLNAEIEAWVNDNLDFDDEDYNVSDITITDSHTGHQQGSEECKEWCDQHQGIVEDCYYGDYYWETEVDGKFLCIPFGF